MTSDRSCTKPSHNLHDGKRRSVGILGLLCGALVLLAGYYLLRRPGAGTRHRRPDAAAGPRREPLAPGVHLLGGLKPSAAYVVATSEGLVLIDSGLERPTRVLSVADGGARPRLARRARHLAHPRPRRPFRRCPVPARDDGGEGLAGAGDAAVLRAGGRARHSSAHSKCPSDTTPHDGGRGTPGRGIDRLRGCPLPGPGHSRTYPGKYLLHDGGADLRALFAAM